MSDIWNQPCNTEYSFPHRNFPYTFLQGSTTGHMWGPINPTATQNIPLSLPELEIITEHMRPTQPPKTARVNKVQRGRQIRN